MIEPTDIFKPPVNKAPQLDTKTSTKSLVNKSTNVPIQLALPTLTANTLALVLKKGGKKDSSVFLQDVKQAFDKIYSSKDVTAEEFVDFFLMAKTVAIGKGSEKRNSETLKLARNYPNSKPTRTFELNVELATKINNCFIKHLNNTDSLTWGTIARLAEFEDTMTTLLQENIKPINAYKSLTYKRSLYMTLKFTQAFALFDKRWRNFFQLLKYYTFGQTGILKRAPGMEHDNQSVNMDITLLSSSTSDNIATTLAFAGVPHPLLLFQCQDVRMGEFRDLRVTGFIISYFNESIKVLKAQSEGNWFNSTPLIASPEMLHDKNSEAAKKINLVRTSCAKLLRAIAIDLGGNTGGAKKSFTSAIANEVEDNFDLPAY